MREAERERMFDEYSDRQNDIMTAVVRHIENLKRLLNGTESKIKQGKAENLKK